MIRPEKLRRDFPILSTKVNGRRLVYLDNAATTQKPRQVLDAIRDYYSRDNANAHRSAHFLAGRATAALEASREKMASFIGASSPRETIFVRNATEALNLVAGSWGASNLRRGDEVLLSVMEHHSNLVPWQAFQKRGVRLVFSPALSDGSFDYEAFEANLSKKTKLVAITQKSNVLGTTLDARRICNAAHDNGSTVLLDGAQSVPSMKVDVRRFGCDFLAFSGHKMFGPMATGVLFGREELLSSMPPFLLGGDMVRSVSAYSAVWNDLPHKFEAGTSDVAGAVGLAAAIDYLDKIGMDNLHAHLVLLTRYALSRLSEYSFVKTFGPSSAAKRPGVVSFKVEGVHPHDVSEILDSQGVAVRAGYHCAQPLVESLAGGPLARASFYAYNTTADIDALCDGLEKVASTFRVGD